MAGFLEALNVIEDDGHWTASPYPVEYFERGFETTIVDICDPVPRNLREVSVGEDSYPFAIVGTMKVSTRCTPEELQAIAVEAMAESTEYQVSKVIWEGSSNVPDFSNMLSEAEAVTRGADYAATVAKVLERAYEKNANLTPLLHLGFQTALVLGFGLQNLGIPYVVPCGYPADAVACTDIDVTVRLSPITYGRSLIRDVNRLTVELSRFASVEFDLTKAVRAT